MSEDDDPVWDRFAHLHAQDDSHDAAYIVTNRAAAEAMRDGLTEALAAGKADVEMLAADGEGYTLRIAVDDVSFEDAGTRWALPYACEFAQDDRPHVIRPWQRWVVTLDSAPKAPSIKGGAT